MSHILLDQPVFHQILKNAFTNKKIPHAFLIVGDQAHDAAHYIAQSLICDHDLLACQKCSDCDRIIRHIYGDLIFIDGKEQSIKKSHIEHIQDEFSKSSLEGKAKIYLLENIENSTSEAMNSLLKLLEEPIDGVYAIFTCKNLSRVLPTIQSRCQIIQLLPPQKKSFINELKKENLSDDDINILSELFHSIDECRDYIDSELFEELKNEVYHFMDDLYFKKENLIIDVETHLLKKYPKDKKIIRLFLNMLVLSMKDLFHVKHNLPLTYPSYLDLYKRVEVSVDRLIEQINLVLDTDYLLDTNANILLLMESMMYRL